MLQWSNLHVAVLIGEYYEKIYVVHLVVFRK